jgi:hypothetical protein
LINVKENFLLTFFGRSIPFLLLLLTRRHWKTVFWYRREKLSICRILTKSSRDFLGKTNDPETGPFKIRENPAQAAR